MEFLKEFWHFLLTGRARAEVGSSLPTDEELAKAHSEFVKNLDQLIESIPVPIAPPPPPLIQYLPKIHEPRNKPVYQLSPSQVERLAVSARIGDVAWSIPQPRPGDDPELQEGLDKLNQEIADLQGLGLIEDVSEHFKEKIEKAMKIHNRHVRYYTPTTLTFQLFATAEYYREDGQDDYKVRERLVQ